IENPISAAPGFTIGNVHVLAGVPRIMQAMLERLVPTLDGGPRIEARAVHVIGLSEGLLAEGLGQVQARFPAVEIGSYPFYRASGNGVAIVGRSNEVKAVQDAITQVSLLIGSFGGTVIPGEPTL
ncbi:MAG: competence/damage-inducible protein A, partial [Pseudomonadota bacterium]|nr:competence/damage-inducible protein A [Pseudomonadota bacterium]